MFINFIKRLKLLVFLGAAISAVLPFSPVAYADDRPTVSTFQAGSITETTAELNGSFAQSLEESVIIWFEYGASPSLQSYIQA